MRPAGLWAPFPPPHLVPGSWSGDPRGPGRPACRGEGLCPASQGLGCGFPRPRGHPSRPRAGRTWGAGRRGRKVSPAQKAAPGGGWGCGFRVAPGLARPRLGGASAPPPRPRSPSAPSSGRGSRNRPPGRGEEAAASRVAEAAAHLNPCSPCPCVLRSVHRPAMAARVPAPRILLLLLLLLPPPPGGEPLGVGWSLSQGRDSVLGRVVATAVQSLE